jgi:hypothetical protein
MEAMMNIRGMVYLSRVMDGPDNPKNENKNWRMMNKKEILANLLPLLVARSSRRSIAEYNQYASGVRCS